VGVKQEGVAVGRSFAIFKNYHIDGNKEMIAFGLMNIAGSCTSCYLTAGIYIYVFPTPKYFLGLH
jgi:MFS superfamily sulfate permease-like transporter